MADTKRPSRAEAVRSRRAKRERKGRRGAQPAAPPPPAKTAKTAPVLMRGLKVEVPLERKKGAAVRRRYDISLQTPGAEVQLPAVGFLRPSWRWLSALLAASLLTLLGLMWNHPRFLVGAIEVQGLERLEVRELNLVLGIENAPVFTLDPARMEHDLMLAFPEFQRVEVRISLPNAVSLTVEERQPVLGWLNAQGMVLVDVDGVSFPARGLVTDGGRDTTRGGQLLPVIHAPDLVMAQQSSQDGAPAVNPYVGRQLLTTEQVSALLVLSQAAPAGSELVFDPQHGMGWEDPGGWVVFFGEQGGDMAARLQVYAAILQDLENERVTPAFISVEYLHAPYYRMER